MSWLDATEYGDMPDRYQSHSDVRADAMYEHHHDGVGSEFGLLSPSLSPLTLASTHKPATSAVPSSVFPLLTVPRAARSGKGKSKKQQDRSADDDDCYDDDFVPEFQHHQQFQRHREEEQLELLPHQLGEPVDLSMDTPYQIRVTGLQASGAKSRVETHIRLCVQLLTKTGEKVTDWKYLNVPPSLLSKDRIKPMIGFETGNGNRPSDANCTLTLGAIVICASNPSFAVSACEACIIRERKRALKRKEGLKNKRVPVSPSENKLPSASQESLDAVAPPLVTPTVEHEPHILQFNCAPTILFTGGDSVLPTRITCYCRHHREKVGFRILFTLTNSAGEKVAAGLSPPVLITDDHKSKSSGTGTGSPSTNAIKRSREDSLSDETASLMPYPTPPPTISRSASISSTPPVLKTEDLDEDIIAQPIVVPLTNKSLAWQNSSRPVYASGTYVPQLKVVPPSNPSGSAMHAQNRSLFSEVEDPSFSTPPRKALRVEESNQSSPSNSIDNLPEISRVVPSEGPIAGGIEVTVLGSDFYDGLVISFGGNDAWSTMCWSPTTLVCILPPAATSGVVAVTVRSPNERPRAFDAATSRQEILASLASVDSPESSTSAAPALFRYKDESDRQLMELALQVVGMKMTGKFEDIRQIARSIVQTNTEPDEDISFMLNSMQEMAHVLSDTRTPLSLEQRVMFALHKALSSFETDFYVDISVQNSVGLSMLHLAAILNQPALVSFLVEHGADLNLQDNNGFTPLHHAIWSSYPDIVRVLFHAGAKVNIRNSYGKLAMDLAETTDGSPALDMIRRASEDSIQASGDAGLLSAASFEAAKNHLFRLSTISLSSWTPSMFIPMNMPNFPQLSQQLQDLAHFPQFSQQMREFAHFPDLPALAAQFPPAHHFFDASKFVGSLGGNSSSMVADPNCASTAAAPSRVTTVEKVRRRKRDRMLYNFWIPVLCVLVALSFLQFFRANPILRESFVEYLGVEIVV